MWVKFDKIEYKDDLKSKRTGNTYSAYVVSGTKMGYKEAPDEPWQKVFFDNSSTTIIEKGVARPNMSIVGFFTHGLKEGDRIEIKNERIGSNWEIQYIKKMDEIPTYVPLTEEEAARIAAEQNAPTRTAPTAPTYTPVNELPF